MVRSCVRAALMVEGGVDPGWELPRDADPSDFVAAVRRHRVTETIVDNLGGGLDLPDEVAEILIQGRRSNAVKVMLLVRELGKALDLLRERGVPILVFKGAALAVATTGDFTARGPGDLDLWVAPDCLARAHAALSSGGWLPVSGYPSDSETWAWRHLMATSYEMPMVSPSADLDLHWRIHPSASLSPDFKEAWARGRSVQIDGIDVPTLSDADAFRHSCVHAAHDECRWLRSIVDIHRLAGLPEVREECFPRLSGVEREALEVVRTTIGLPQNVDRLISQRPRRSVGRVLRRAQLAQESPVPLPGEDPPGSQLISAFRCYGRGASSPRDRLHIAYGLALPAAGVGRVRCRSAITGIPFAVALRARYVVSRLRSAQRSSRRQ